MTARGVLALTRELVAIPSVTGEEAAVARRIAERCAALGLDTRLDEVAPGRPNVVATLAGAGGPTLLLTGHVDVVPPGQGWSRDPFDPVVDGDRLYGRGAADMKGGLAAMLTALAAVAADGVAPAGDVVFAAVVGEEEDQAGTAHLVRAGLRADAAVVGEPTDARVVRGHKGCVAYRLTLRGKAAHASVPEAGVNAIDQATDVVMALRQTARTLAGRPHAALGPGTLTVGTIDGGTRPYVVPDHCRIEVDRRLVPGETVETAVAEARAALAVAAERWGPLDAELEVLAGALPFDVPADHRLVRLAADALAAAGGSGEVTLWSAVSDASILANDGGIPSVLLGPGSVAGAAHQPDESVAIEELVVVARAYEALIRGQDRLRADG